MLNKMENEWIGTTSACAENTSRFKRSIRSRWNYLRVRGEYKRAL